MATQQEVAIQVAIVQRNEAMNAALNAAVEANLQRERADALQKELEELKKPKEAEKEAVTKK